MPVPMLDLVQQYATIEDEINRAVAAVVRSQRFIMGPPVDRLEAEIAALIGVRHAIGCASGTDALLLTLKALELSPGSEVIVPAFTFFGTAGAVWNAGLKPVFADIEPATYNLTATTVERALSPQTRAVFVVHLYGQMADLGPLIEQADRLQLTMVEDAAQSIRARQQIDGVSRDAGTLGATGCFSFFPTKNLGGYGDGGLITTEDDVLAERLRKLRVHGGRQMYHHELVGTNSRLDALQAAVLSAKLPFLEQWTTARREHAAYYDQQFAGVPDVSPPFVQPGNYHVFNQYTIRVRDRDALKQHLDARGIGNAVYYPVALHLQECFRSLGYKPGDLPESEQACREVLSLPMFPELRRDQQDEVVETIARFYQNR